MVVSPLSSPLTTQTENKPRVRVLCLPDVDRAIGGVKQLYRHVEHLTALGWDAAMVTEAEGFRPSWFDTIAPSLSLHDSWQRGELAPDRSILVLPETYIGVDLSNFHGLNLSELKRVVLNQNAYYSYGEFMGDAASRLFSFYDDPLVLQVLSISEDTHQFLSRNMGIADHRLSRVVNSIEPIFRADQQKCKRMHWMPRKNPQHVHAILQGLSHGAITNTQGWLGEPLHQLTHAQVAAKLNGAQLFLAFGHPEGFGLPIAEAMASGCWVIGYSGGGGRELFRYGASEHIEFGDWPGFISAIQTAFSNFAQFPRETELRLQRQALAIKTLYSCEQERKSIDRAWQRIHHFFRMSSSSP